MAYGISKTKTLAEYSKADVAKVCAALGNNTRCFQVNLTLNPLSIPLHICLGPTLTDPVELACAEAVAKHLSSECGRVVGVAELEGLVLYLWSEDELEGKALGEYFGPQSRPLQGLLLQSRTLEGQPEHLVRAELVPFVGKKFELLAGC